MIRQDCDRAKRNVTDSCPSQPVIHALRMFSFSLTTYRLPIIRSALMVREVRARLAEAAYLHLPLAHTPDAHPFSQAPAIVHGQLALHAEPAAAPSWHAPTLPVPPLLPLPKSGADEPGPADLFIGTIVPDAPRSDAGWTTGPGLRHISDVGLAPIRSDFTAVATSIQGARSAIHSCVAALVSNARAVERGGVRIPTLGHLPSGSRTRSQAWLRTK